MVINCHLMVINCKIWSLINVNWEEMVIHCQIWSFDC